MIGPEQSGQSVWTVIAGVPWDKVALGVGGIVIAGWVLHELTHYVVARLLGANPSIVPGIRFKTTYDRQWPVWDELFGRLSHGYYRELAIQIAPQVIGVLVGIAYITVYGMPPFTFEAYAGTVAWFFYVYSPADWRLLTRTVEIDDLSKQALLALGVFFGGWAANMNAIGTSWAIFTGYLFMACMLAALGLIVLGIYDNANWERSTPQ